MNKIRRKLCQLANFIIPVYSHIQMLTNKAVYDFIPGYSGFKKDAVQYFWAHYIIPYDHESMDSKVISDLMYRMYDRCKKLVSKRNDAFWSEELEIRVLPYTYTCIT